MLVSSSCARTPPTSCTVYIVHFSFLSLPPVLLAPCSLSCLSHVRWQFNFPWGAGVVESMVCHAPSRDGTTLVNMSAGLDRGEQYHCQLLLMMGV